MKKFFTLIIFLICLSACKKVSITSELKQLQNLTCERVDVQSFANTTIDIEEKLSTGISKDEAIQFALCNNLYLKAALEGLGIAKSEFLQATLYRNPLIDGRFYIPIKGSVAEIESGISFAISELWQIPFRKSVKKDDIEIIIYKILELILEIITETKLTYDKILFLQKQIDILNGIYNQNIELKKDFSNRKKFGLSSNLEELNAEAKIESKEIELFDLNKELLQSYCKLREIIGIQPNTSPIKLNESFEINLKELPELDYLLNTALIYRPELLNANLKVKKQKDVLLLEKAKVLKEFNLGASYKRDFDGSFGVGPSLSMEIPIFDQNQGEISKAEYLLNQAKKEFEAEKLKIIKEVNQNYIELSTLIKIISKYKNKILKINEKEINFTSKYKQLMQLKNTTLIETKINLFENKIKYNQAIYNALKAFAQLERAIGKKI